MERKSYEKISIKKDDRTNYLCPVCKMGYLVSESKNITEIDYNSYNSVVANIDGYDPEWLKHSFIGKLVCDNSRCQEEYAFGGKAVVDYISGEYDTFNG